MIEVKNVTKSFGDFSALRNLNFRIEKKSGITALLGPNGAGKTTTMRLLTGFLRPTSGEIFMNGLSVRDDRDLVEIKKNVGYLPENSPLYPEMLVSEYLEFMGQVRGLKGDALEKQARKMIDALELGSHFYSPVGILSKGFRQRVALAATLIHNPEIIILDEPTSGLDPNQIQQIRSLIKELAKEKTLIISTHIMQEVEDICERVIIISRGQVAADENTEALRVAHSCAIVAKGEGIKESLLSFDGVRGVWSEDNARDLPQGFVRYICQLESDTPEKLFSQVAVKGWEIREFSPLSKSLEDVFRDLTN
ncbi:MAG: ATP-binding cassette domain-containing protein [Spirochaetia bacterium]|nr:ATP-binding cassette domain-containing protein [Spirochaetia bacterium]